MLGNNPPFYHSLIPQAHFICIHAVIPWFRLREIGHLMIVEVLLVDHSAQWRFSRLIILTTQAPTLMTINQHALPLPNFKYLVQLEALVLGFSGFWIVLGIYCSPRATPTHPCAHPHLSYIVPTFLFHIDTSIHDHLG